MQKDIIHPSLGSFEARRIPIQTRGCCHPHSNLHLTRQQHWRDWHAFDNRAFNYALQLAVSGPGASVEEEQTYTEDKFEASRTKIHPAVPSPLPSPKLSSRESSSLTLLASPRHHNIHNLSNAPQPKNPCLSWCLDPLTQPSSPTDLPLNHPLPSQALAPHAT